ncbi:kinesin-like protein KIF11-A [Tribolium castaneum]|uniref:Kinesin motor domain-containing protein n=1 Tax=Tribolium castaneum TaxID=7070 RepID=D6W6M7_TRICA|nr:PREDICTED: kinesin-like protein KIF11-A [Tribolium castaneum]EFA10972.1 hypothetical protein TcasGA2_TC004134 [Tribolium castaneum]|eukprot:XP_001807209.1 PREDICTED: kinesin-like protein KIF11-A [Tribolium castaneum]
MFGNRPIHPIRVCVRARPLTQSEISANAPKVVKYMNTKHLLVRRGVNKRKRTYDRVFSEHADQIEVFRHTVARFISSITRGYSFTFFAYGPTGTGKSYTLFGEGEQALVTDFKKDRAIGLIQRAAYQLFCELEQLDSSRVEYTVRLSFIEINHEQVFDLLVENGPLRVYDDPLENGSVCIKDMSKVTVFNADDVNDWVNVGRRTLRKSAYYAYLSHLMVTFFVDIRETTPEGAHVLRTARLSFVEVAGGEHATEIDEGRTLDTAVVHQSLDAFEECIKALGMQQRSIPYSSAKLTRIVQNSLGGTARACFMSTFSTSTQAWTEILSSLQIATLMKRVANYPRLNTARTLADATRELDGIIARKETELAEMRQALGPYVRADANLTEDQISANKKIVDLLRELLELREHRALLEAEYRRLDASFIRTKRFREYAHAQLEADQDLTEQQRRCLVRRFIARNNEMIQNANNLLDMCEERIAQAKIPPRQVQVQADASNADLAKQVVEVTTDALSDVEQATSSYKRQQLTRVVKMAQLNTYLRRRFLADLQQISDMMGKIKDLRPLDINDLLNDQARSSADQIAYFIDNIYGEVSHYMKLPDQPKAEIGKMNEGIAADIEEVTRTETEVRAELDRHQAERSQHYNLVFRFFDDLLKKLDEREARIRIQFDEGNASVECLNNEMQKAKRDKEILVKEVLLLQEAMQFVRDQLNGKDGSFFEEASKMMSVPGKMAFSFENLNVGEVSEQFSNTVNDFYTESTEQAENIEDFTDDIVDAFKSVVQTHNNHNARTARQIQTIGKGVRENILEKAYANTTHIAKIAEGASANQEYYASKTRNIVDQVMDQLESIHGKIQFPPGEGEEASAAENDPENIENVAPRV